MRFHFDKMESGRKKEFYFCWVLLFLMSVYFIRVSSGQPQVYFKAVPAKSLPRIGRRSEIKILPGDPYEDFFYHYYPPQLQRKDQDPGDVAGKSLFWKNLVGQDENLVDPARFYHID